MFVYIDSPGLYSLLQAAPPECEYWNFQLNNYWMESLDYCHFTIHVNKHTGKPEGDGERVFGMQKDLMFL